MALFAWNSSFSVQVAEIDKQHQQLIELIGRLHDAMSINQGKSVIEQILAEMVDYISFHFSTEEKYMQQFGYGEYEQHRREHEDFVHKTGLFQEDYANGKRALTGEVLDFLYMWVENHILHTDRKYTECFKENGLA